MTLRVSSPRVDFSAAASIAVIACCSFFAGCDHARPAAANAAPPPAAPVAVTLVAAREADVERLVVVSGDLRSDEDATLSVKIAGRLADLRVDLGDRVKTGDDVAKSDDVDAVLQVEQARALLQQSRARVGLAPDDSDPAHDAVDPDQTAEVRVAKATLDESILQEKRAREMLATQVSTQAEYDAADAAKKVAENRYRAAREEVGNRIALIRQRRAELAIAEQRLKDTEITAPFDGVVVERRAGRGDYLDTGAPIATLARVDPLRLVAMVPERVATAVTIGQRVRFSIAGTKETLETRVQRVSSVLDSRNRALRIEADVPNPDGKLKAGAFTEASLIVEEHARAVLIPSAAIRSFAGFDKVLVIADGKIAEHRVTLGTKRGDEVEVTTGVAAGERIVAVPGSLQPGMPATVAGN